MTKKLFTYLGKKDGAGSTGSAPSMPPSGPSAGGGESLPISTPSALRKRQNVIVILVAVLICGSLLILLTLTGSSAPKVEKPKASRIAMIKEDEMGQSSWMATQAETVSKTQKEVEDIRKNIDTLMRNQQALQELAKERQAPVVTTANTTQGRSPVASPFGSPSTIPAGKPGAGGTQKASTVPPVYPPGQPPIPHSGNAAQYPPSDSRFPVAQLKPAPGVVGQPSDPTGSSPGNQLGGDPSGLYGGSPSGMPPGGPPPATGMPGPTHSPKPAGGIAFLEGGKSIGSGATLGSGIAGAPPSANLSSAPGGKTSGANPGNTTGAANVQNAGAAEKGQRGVYYLPSGSFTKAILISGMDAPTGSRGKGNPHPVLMKLTDPSIIPNDFKFDIAGCFIVGEGYGELSAERAYIRTITLSCVKNGGKAVLDTPMKGYVVGEDGKIGLRGDVVSKTGMILGRLILAGFVQGMSEAFGQAKTSVTLVPTIGGNTTTVDPNKAMQYAGYTGVSKAMDHLAKYYTELSQDVFPVIEVETGRRVHIVVTAGQELKFKEVNVK